MIVPTQRPWLFFFVILGIYTLSWHLQNTLLLNSDVSWLMLAARRMLAGGTYTQDFFEINPPMILYIYTPAVWIAKIFSLSADIALRVYVYLLASLSLCCCWRLVKIGMPDTNGMREILLTALAIIFLCVPLSEFGQREHVLMIFILPYLLLIANRLQDKTSGSAIFYLLIGCMAGCGFVIKPYFLMPLLFLEIYLMRFQRKWFAWFRPEVMGIAIIFLLAANIIFIVHRDYITQVVPLVSRFYYQKYGLSLETVTENPQAVFAYGALVFYLLSHKSNPYKALSTVLAIAVLGFLASSFLQQTAWYYHSLPFFSLSILLCTTLFGFWAQIAVSFRENIFAGLFAASVFGLFFWQLNYIRLSIFLYPVGYFSLFAFVFGFLFYVAHTRKSLAVIATAMTLLAGILLQTYLLHSPLQTHSFLLTTSLLMLVFVLFIPRKSLLAPTLKECSSLQAGSEGSCYATHKKRSALHQIALHSVQSETIKLKFTCFALLGIALFAYPFYEIAYVYNYSIAYKKLYGNLLKTLNTFSNKSVYVFSNSADFTFPALDYTHQKFASRFGCLGWVPSLSYWDPDAVYASAYQQNKSIANFFIPAMIEDIHHHQPDLILVDMRNTNTNHIKSYFGNVQIDYLRFFLQNPQFQTTWKNYHYLKTVDGQPLFKFMIYERNTTLR
jgi:hypothetical protein